MKNYKMNCPKCSKEMTYIESKKYTKLGYVNMVCSCGENLTLPVCYPDLKSNNVDISKKVV